jgi:cytochrome c-type biogenesis protein CcmF
VRQDPGQAAGAARFAQQVLDRTVDKVARLYLKQSPPVTFRVIVNPLVSWMWIGALIALAGAVIAIWPTPGARRRRVSSLYGARLGRELSRA